MMPSTARHALLFIAIGLACSLGCEDKEAKQARVYRQALSEVMEKLDTAGRGYVGVQTGLTDPKQDLDGFLADIAKRDLGAFRQDKLAEAGKQLAPLTRQPLSDAAKRLMAEVHVSAARDQTRKALTAWTVVANRTTTLVSQLIAVSRADARAQLFDTDETSLLTDLHEQQQRISSELTELKGQAARSTNAIDAAQVKIDGLIAKRDASLDNAQSYRSRAFVKSGQEQFDLYGKANESQRAADTNNAQAEKFLIRVDVDRSALAIVNKQIELKQNAIRNIQKRVDAAQTRQETAQRRRDEAKQAKVDIVDDLDKEFNALLDTYKQEVTDAFEKANVKVDQAITLLKGRRLSDRTQRRFADLDMLSKLVNKTRVLSEQILTIDGFASSLSVVAERGSALMVEHADDYRSTVKGLLNKRSDLIAGFAADEVMKDAAALADKLRDGPEEQAAIVQTYENQLGSYGQRIGDVD